MISVRVKGASPGPVPPLYEPAVELILQLDDTHVTRHFINYFNDKTTRPEFCARYLADYEGVSIIYEVSDDTADFAPH